MRPEGGGVGIIIYLFVYYRQEKNFSEGIVFSCICDFVLFFLFIYLFIYYFFFVCLHDSS